RVDPAEPVGLLGARLPAEHETGSEILHEVALALVQAPMVMIPTPRGQLSPREGFGRGWCSSECAGQVVKVTTGGHEGTLDRGDRRQALTFVVACEPRDEERDPRRDGCERHHAALPPVSPARTRFSTVTGLRNTQRQCRPA